MNHPKTIEELDIDPRALYTLDQAAKMFQELEPWRPIEDCKREIAQAVADGKLKLWTS